MDERSEAPGGTMTPSADDGAPRRRRSGELEAEVLGALWASEEPLTAGQVQRVLGGGLAYNTVHTILVRLHGKGLVSRTEVGRAHVYSAAMPAADLVAERMHRLLDGGPDRQEVLQRFVGTLSADDEQMLLGMLRRTE